MTRIRNNYMIFALFLSLIFYSCSTKMPEAVFDISLSEIENFQCDGKPDDWSKIENFRLWSNPAGGCPDTSNLRADLKVSWTKNKLVLLLDVKDQSYAVDTINPWKGDAIEVFISPYRGSEYIFQASIIPRQTNDFISLTEYENDSLPKIATGKINSFTHFIGSRRITEIEIELVENDTTQKSFRDFALQVYVDDTDSGDPSLNQLTWYPVGQTYNSSSSMYPVKLTKNVQTILKGTSRLVITDNEIISLYVFGGFPGEKIGIYKNGVFLTEYNSGHKPDFKPDSIDISKFDWDIENDSLFVVLGKKSLGFHEFFLAHRLYEKLEVRRFEKDIRYFISKDRQQSPPANATLFIGSSSIVRWSSLKKDFPELQIIKRGFGGSTSQDALMYINQIVLPYKPSQIIYYEGDNDIPMGISSEEIRDNIKTFAEQIATYLPQTKIYLLSPKPSINRMHLWEKYKNTHALLRELANQYKNIEYIDVATPMFKKDGQLNNSLFVEDGIHMNTDGYAIWTKILRKALELDK